MKQEQIDALRYLPIPDQGLLIDGQWAAAASDQTLPYIHFCTHNAPMGTK